MLEPNTRKLLLDCLQPPDEFVLDRAIGTTYSLDLYALLSVPVAFVFREAVTDDGQIDPLATLEALRRHAANIHVFCQAGAIHVPRGQERLFAYLEESVIPVSPPSESGVFHPKTWLLRFAGPDDAIAYRFVCLSRNLTFDRSWDTVLALDGQLQGTRVRDPDPQPLRDFLAALPGLARRPVREETRSAIRRVADELSYVSFDLPQDVDAIRFCPLGVPGAAPPSFSPSHRPLLIASPFLSEEWLKQHAQGRSATYLISREDQLLGLPAPLLDQFKERYTLVQEATPEEDMEAQGEDEDLLDGLHAKLFVMDDGWDAHVWTGSANATNAAFHHNVEMLVELIGKKSKLGIDTLLAENDNETSFRHLLDIWRSPETEPDKSDPVIQRLEEHLYVAQRALARAELGISLTESDTDDHYAWTLNGKWPRLGDAVSGVVRPIGLEPEQARPISREAVRFDAITLEGISAFVAVELTASEADQARKARFVLRLPIKGLPEDRANRLLRRMLQDRSQFMRLLVLLLADDGLDALMSASTGDSHADVGQWLAGDTDTPVLETLLKALDRSPERLDQIKRLLDDLSDSGNIDLLLPDGFLAIWEAVWANRKHATTDV
ncbi:hypothetical protein [Spectribacter hydrogenoxidans]|uniref:PLD phosphodiesterase domain-containing protein n=1 Tax=Spectribacter hydrogenoxidans TaxID=3075608 RepID=A0ABU3C005_9GAMM|nr:hypothetical protein [Salinisphaera sp. W335]MDT0634889.1 hypothetical protein [Salinisphaera sp. W335]